MMFDNVITIIIGLLFATGVVVFIVNQKKSIEEWLLLAVIEAEKQLGSKTGKIKLRLTFDWFISTFPIISKFVSFNVFSSLVDTALIEMKSILDDNKECKNYVKGDE